MLGPVSRMARCRQAVSVVVVVVVVVIKSDETILAIQLGGYNTKRTHVCPKEYITRARKQL
jgi:hypothetical protein